MTDQIDILLATYQGASYLQQQIDSILNQTYPNFHLWIRDDQSSDDTLVLLNRLAQQHPQKISLVSSQQNSLVSSQQNLGAKGNFSELMKHGQSNYVMFADQDDVWLPHKIEASFNFIKTLEKVHGMHTPLLVHTDLKVVRTDLSNICESFWRYTHLDPSKTSLNRILAQNIVTGCTMLMNRYLVDLAQPIPHDTVMHDWWITLVASAFGKIGHLHQPTLLYRQHGSNDIGAKKYGLWKFLKRKAIETQKQQHCLQQTYKQAQLFLEYYHHLLNAQQKEILKNYASLERLSYFARKKQILKFQFFKHGFLRNVKMLVGP